MIGYKVFIWRWFDSGWTGPFYKSPSSWKIAQERTLTNNTIDINPYQECAPGINFFQKLKHAIEFIHKYRDGLKIYRVIYKVKTPKDAIVVKVLAPANIYTGCEHWELARANKVKLVKRIGFYKNDKKVSKKR